MGIISQIGYSLGLPGMGISEPWGTPYDVNQTPGSYSGAVSYMPSTQGSNTSVPLVSTNPTINPYSKFIAKTTTTPTTGQVLGTQTTPNTTSGGQQIDPYAGIRNNINSGYDSYFASLDQQLNTNLPQQYQSQQDIVNNQYSQGVNNLDTQRSLGYSDLGLQETRVKQNQVTSLRDLAENIRNAFNAGNNYLGARGAGDSSAANQYAFGLTKLGTQQRTGVMNNTANILGDINARRGNIDTIYNSEKNNLNFERNNKINQVAQWFMDAQNALKQARANGELSRSQDLASLSQNYLNMGISAINTINSDMNTKMQLLGQWAQGQRSSVINTISQIQNQGATKYQLPSHSPIVGTPQLTAGGGFNVPVGYGFSNTDNTKLFDTNSNY